MQYLRALGGRREFGRFPWPLLAVGGMFLLTRAVAFGGLLYAEHGSVRQAVKVAGSGWDSSWYQMIVAGWYAGTNLQFPKAGFYPGYPLLIEVVYQPLRALGTLLNPHYRPAPPPPGPEVFPGHDPLLLVSLLIVANACLVIALVALWRLFEPKLGAPATVLGCCLLLAVPSSFFLSFGYSESSFIAATVLAFLFAEKGRWRLAGLAGAAACLIRMPGAALVVALGLCWLLQMHRREAVQQFVFGMALIVLGTAVFPIYTWAAFGDPMLYMHLQASNWSHHASNPLVVWLQMIKRVRWGALAALGRGPSRAVVGPPVEIVDGLMTVWATACAALGWLRLPPWHVVWIGMMLLYPLLSSPPNLFLMSSINRHLLDAWPAFFLTAWWLRRRPLLAGVCIVACLVGLFSLAHQHATGFVA